MRPTLKEGAIGVHASIGADVRTREALCGPREPGLLESIAPGAIESSTPPQAEGIALVFGAERGSTRPIAVDRVDPARRESRGTSVAVWVPVRFAKILHVIASLALVACDATEPAGTMPFTASAASAPPAQDASADSAAPPVGEARGLFDALLSDLVSACGGCHGQGTNAPLWLAPPDRYASIKGYEGLVTPDPSASKLLAKGRHSGPDFAASLRARVEAWLDAEAKALAPSAPITTGKFGIARGPNVRELAGVGKAPSGTRLSFDASWFGAPARMKLSGITVAAPPSAGVRVVHPRFTVVRGQGTVDDRVDAFSTLDQTIAAGAKGILGDGVIFLDSEGGEDELVITFEDLEPLP